MSSSPKSAGTRSFLRGIVQSRGRSGPEMSNTSELPSSSGLPRYLPEWLVRFLNEKKYRTRVLEVLVERERIRAGYRGLTPSASQTSAPKLSALPSSPSSSKSYKSSDEAILEFYATRNACSRWNEDTNRYADVVPYDRHAVFVNTRVGEDTALNSTSGLSYLNASWAKESTSNVWWIAAQAPLPDTIPTFLALCTSLTPAAARPRVIVQLTAPIEAGRRKAHEYLPKRAGRANAIRYPLRIPRGRRDETREEIIRAELEVVLCEIRDIPEAGSVESRLELTVCTWWSSTDGNGKRREREEREEPTRVTHYYYGAWPDHGVPSEPETILNLARLVEDSSTRMTSGGNMPRAGNDGNDEREGGAGRVPVLVHCSAGVGRTGTFIAISAALRQCGGFGKRREDNETPVVSSSPSPLGALPSLFDGDVVMREIDHLREYRCMMVQQSEQAAFVYTVLGCALGASA